MSAQKIVHYVEIHRGCDARPNGDSVGNQSKFHV